MPSHKLREYLDKSGLKYVIIYHSQAFTAQEIAAASHISARELAKTVIVKINDKLVIAVEPANIKVDLDKLKKEAHAKKVELATEAEFKGSFPECEIGAMPPLGPLYDLDVYVAESLTHSEYIVFNACSHTELIKMKYADFAKLVKPKVF